MDERAVRAAAERITREAHGLYLGTGEECRLVPLAAIVELVEAIDAPPAATAEPTEAAEPPADVPLDRSPVT